MAKKSTRRNSQNNKVLNEPQPVPTSNPNDVLEREVEVPDTYVVSAEEANKKPAEFSFFSRVLSIPLVRDSSSLVQHYATQYSLTRYAYNTAESTVKYAASVASPYAEKFKPQLLKVDQLGCQSLDIVETKFPVVTKEADELLTTPQKVYKDVKETLLSPVTRTTNSLHNLVNKYLPPSQEEKKKGDGDNFYHNDDVKLSTLANEVKDRLTHRVTTRLQSLPHSRADISRLAETNQLLNEAFLSIQKANTRLQDLIVSLKGYKDTTQSKANQRIHELTLDLIHRLDAAAAYVKEHQVMNNLPSPVHIVVDPLLNFATNEYEIVRNEVLKPDGSPLQKATNILHLTQEYVMPLIQKSIHGVEEQVRQYRNYANNSRVVQDVKSTFGFVKVKA